MTHIPGVAGVDEAGRGPLAGPVVAAAVVLPEGFDVRGLNDSKKLDPAAREEQAVRIRAEAAWSIAIGSLETIERRNILQATFEAMVEVVENLAEPPERVLIDGSQVPPRLRGRAEAVVKGDGRYACIAAASILAKTERDRLMVEMADLYPEYGFDRHFGYGTPEHLEAIARYGPCPIHRLTFRPFAAEEQPCLALEM